MADYFAPYIDDSGLHIPEYQAILDKFIASTKSIYGQDIYLDIDSKDYQYISILALSAHDNNQALVEAYNCISPITAIGAALSKVVKYNGLRRQTASYSTCDVILTGTNGTVITAGSVKDISGNIWDLPTPLTIPVSGTLETTATSRTIGDITALAGAINIINTPTAGWISVTNPTSAIQGTPVETDAELRARQAISTFLPSSTVLEGTIARISALDGVTRNKVYENPTHYIDENGLMPHSIWAIVEGGTIADIAQAIYDNKGICGVNGDISYTVTGAEGVQEVIQFSRPNNTIIYVICDITPLTGYTSVVKTNIISAISDYLNSLEIGEDVIISSLYQAATSVIVNKSKPTFSITSIKAGIAPNPTLSLDITIEFNAVSYGNIANVSVEDGL